ncbi:DUF3261 domain-containing protein [Stutzerimonas nosocomialis]|uniref:DUF3261 domain-containing protein n=1 Tax=Stutzerimonas nosocomialis TaxID=1056496 RepID=UPI001F4FA954|nr:DUF3261 domain-containing protein [Stutzerimonas nosocomialis]
MKPFANTHAAARGARLPGWAILLIGLLLTACASAPPAPQGVPELALPSQWHVRGDDAQRPLNAILVLQAEGDTLRAVLLDPLGVPLARQRLGTDGWEADGLLPPNPQAWELFAALLFALTPDDQLGEHYGEADWRIDEPQRVLLQRGAVRWQVRYSEQGAMEIEIAAEQRHYRVEPLAPVERSP